MSRLALALALVVSVVCAPRASAAQERAEEVDNPEVVELVFTGVESIPEEALSDHIVTQESRCKSALFRILLLCTVTNSPIFVEKHYLDRSELARDLLRMRIIYWRSGFRSATVDTAVTPLTDEGDKVRVTLSVTEGQPTIVAAIRVLRPGEVLTDEQIARLMRLRAGQPLDLAALDSSRMRIRDALWNRGYADAVIDTAIAVAPDERTATVELRIDPRWVARVGDIIISGNERVGARTILNSLTLKEGDIFERSEVLRSQRSLYESGLFQHATIVIPPQGDTTKLIDITVREAPLQYVRAATGFNTIDFFQVEGRYRNSNWFGRARRLEIRGTLGNLLAEQLSGWGPFQDPTGRIDGDAAPFLRPTWTASAEVRQPWFRSPLNTISATVFGHRRSAPGVFIDRGQGASATFTREIATRMTASASYRFELTRTEASDVYLCVNFGVCDTETITALQRAHRLSPFSLSGNADRSNDPLSPTRGWRARAELEHASGFTLSDFRYSRFSGEGTIYHSLGRSVLAGRLRMGAVRSIGSTAEAVGVVAPEGEPILHPRRRFYAGGSQSVRGYGENQLGPRVLTIDPEKLAAIGCDVSYENIASCDISQTGTDDEGNPVSLDDEDFRPRPLGGNSVLEGNIELRFPIWQQLSGAVFVDGAIVGERNTLSLSGSTAAITPGFGIRFTTPVGPVRADVGINPCLAERLPVVTQAETPDGRLEIVPLGSSRVYSAACQASFLSRLQLHLSIGQAF